MRVKKEYCVSRVYVGDSLSQVAVINMEQAKKKKNTCVSCCMSNKNRVGR